MGFAGLDTESYGTTSRSSGPGARVARLPAVERACCAALASPWTIDASAAQGGLVMRLMLPES